ncbi:uncharacterized protein [Triticum aestivum]|uniref:uncharacterized protein n=1 Tax=Triticum aestivum TaxID=4565 RepID=UPI001D02E7C1|nr:uncharacterized protein LOC123156487 [Triticum aestivum]
MLLRTHWQKRDAKRMNHGDGADPWGYRRPETPLWDVAEYNQLISAGPLLPLLEQYVGIGSYDQNTLSGAPWQVQPQGANTDKCTGSQLQLANVANQEPSCSTWHQAAPMYLPSMSYTSYYGAATPAIVSWQASQIADRARQFGVTDHTRWAHAAQQGPTTIVNIGAGTSTAGSSERTEDTFHQPTNNHAANNAESETKMAIIQAMPTSTALNTSTGNTQVDETAADTEVNDETDDETQGDEDGGQSEIVVPQPPYVGQRFESFTEAKEFYQTYAKFHGFAVNTEYHRKIKKTNEYSRGEMRCHNA